VPARSALERRHLHRRVPQRGPPTSPPKPKRGWTALHARAVVLFACNDARAPNRQRSVHE
jgi:hypothetical protein